MTLEPNQYPQEYYSFESYMTRHRMLTYWYQLREVLATRPSTVLEVGIGTKLVCSYLKSLGITVETADINPALEPQHAVSVLNLSGELPPRSFDAVLCARVLHHLPYESLPRALRELALVARCWVVVTLPVDDCRLYLMTRYTSSPFSVHSLRLPLALKRGIIRLFRGSSADSLYSNGLWKIGSSRETALGAVLDAMSKDFEVAKHYPIPEDCSHHLFVLKTLTAMRNREEGVLTEAG